MPNGRTHLTHPYRQHEPLSKHAQRDIRGQSCYVSKVAVSTSVVTHKQVDKLDHAVPTSSTSIDEEAEELTYYPAYCHKASPTWFEWVKLTAHDIHTKLHVREGHQHSWLAEHWYGRDAPQLMFYLNHPIQFVQVVGVVVSFDEYFERFWLFTIDDSSGATIDVVCRKPVKDDSGGRLNDPANARYKTEGEEEQDKEMKNSSELVTHTVELGAVLQVKGVITLFQRNRTAEFQNELKGSKSSDHPREEQSTRQILLQRLTKVHDTSQEISLIAARTQFRKSVLSQTWTLSHKAQQKLHRQALGDIEHEKKKAKKVVLKRQKAVDVEREDVIKIQQEYNWEEAERVQDAERARRAGQKLQEDLKRRAMTDEDQSGIPVSAPAITDQRVVKSRDGKEKRKRKRGREDVSYVQRDQTIEQADTTNDSFAALEDEKSALLKLAFG